MKRVVRKRRTREHVIADLGINHVERHALESGFVVERIRHDYGIDLELLTFDRNGEMEEGAILIQLKATNRRLRQAGQATFPFRVDRRDLVLWLRQPLPVILIVYTAAEKTAFWLYIQGYFARQKNFNLFEAGKQVTIHLPVDNLVNKGAMRKFARFRDRVLAQMKEILHEQ